MSRLCRLQSFLVATVLSGVFAVPALASPAPAREVAFVDGAVADHEALVAGVRPGVETVRLDPSRDELAQMAAWAETHSGYEAIHVVSHAAPGALRLGGASLDGAALRDPAVAGQLARLGRALNRGGDLLLYGCSLAAGPEGDAYLAALAHVTGADVGASDDQTGAAAKGGDWVLEVAAGAIEARPLAMGDFQDVLSTISFTESDSDLSSGGYPGVSSVTRTEAVSGKAITFRIVSSNFLMGWSSFGIQAPGDSPLGTHLEITVPAGYCFDLTSFRAGCNPGTLNIALTFADGRTSSFIQYIEAYGGLAAASDFSPAIDDVTKVVFTSDSAFEFNDFAITDVKAPPTFSGQYSHSFYDTEVANSFSNVTGTLTATPSSTTNSEITSYGISGLGVTTGGSTNIGGTIYDVSMVGTYGTLYLVSMGTGKGSYAYVPNGAAIEALATRDDEGNISRVTKVESFAVTATDSVGATAENAVSINLTGQNDTPEITSGAMATVAENSAGTVYTATASDRDSGQTRTYSLSGTDAGLFDIDEHTGAVSFKTASDFEAPTDTGGNNVYDITVKATDNAAIVNGFPDSNDSAPKAVQITVTNVNDAPTGGDTTATFDEDSSLVFSTDMFGFSDADGAAFDHIRITALPVVGTMWHDANHDGVSNDAALAVGSTISAADITSGYLRFTPAANASGSDYATFSFKVSDGSLYAAAASHLTFVITPINDAPTGLSISNASVSTLDAANTVVGTLSATDPDSSSFTYTIVIVSLGVTDKTADSPFNVSGSDLRASNPGTTPAGTYSVVVEVSDGDRSYQKPLSIVVDNSLTVTIATDDAYGSGTYASELSDGGGLSLAEAIGLADANAGGTIRFANTLAGLTVAGAAAVDFDTIFDFGNASGITLSGDISIATGKTLTVQNTTGGTVTLAGVISGAGGLRKAGAGTLTLTGTNTYTGATTLSGGTLPTDSLGSTSALVLDGGTLQARTTSFSVSVPISVTGNGGGFDLSNGSITLSGDITGSGALTTTGTGTLTLSGTNTYQGETSVSDGMLAIATDANLGSGAVILDAGSVLSIGGATTIDQEIELSENATITNANAVTLSGVVRGTGGLTKAGTGTLTLSAANTYSGATTVSAGALAVSGSLSGTSGVSVASGATLGGTGTIFSAGSTNTLTVDGTLSPGSGGPGALTVNGNLLLNGTLAVDVASATAGSGYDQVNVAGNVTLGSASVLAMTSTLSGSEADLAVIGNDAAEEISGTFAGLAEGGAPAGTSYFTVSYRGGTGNDLILSFDPPPPPAAPAGLAFATGSDSGTTHGDGITNVTAPTVTGTAEAGSLVTLYDGATVLGTATADGLGHWSITTPVLGEGAHTLTAVASNIGGAGESSVVLSLTIDTTVPAVPSITSTAPVGIMTSAAYTLTGTAEAGATVKLYNASTLVDTVTADADGHWSFELTLAEGASTLTVTATDAAGNVSTAAAAGTWTLDTKVPVVATIARTQTGPVTRKNSLVWRVTFTEPVTGVDAGDFVVTSLVGGASGTVTSVTGANATYLVTVALTGTGRVRLDLVAAGSGIADAAALPLSADFVRGQVYVASSSALPVSWGDNRYGQLGDGTKDSASAPLPMLHGAIPTDQPVVSVVCGDSHSVALTAAGLVYAWGSNSYGQLGNGANTSSTLPVAVSALASETVVAVAAGADFSLALTDDGKVYAWGYNLFGQLGNGTTTNSNAPVEVSALAGKRVVAISAGGGFALALTGDGAVYAWGQNVLGQLGNGTNVGTVTTPAQVTGFSGRPVVAISCGGMHSLALTADGAVYAWGYNYYGQLGNGTTTASNRPVEVTALSGQGVSALQAGAYHSLALTAGTVYAWGFNDNGQLGDGLQTNRLTPVAVGGLTGRDVIELSAGEVHTLALLADGSALIWGTNEQSVLGDSGVSPALTPVPVATTNAMAGRSLLALSTDVSRYSVLALASPTQGALSVSPVGGDLGAGASIVFTVTFPSVVTGTGSPQLVLTIGTETRYATYTSGSGSTSLVFTYTVQAGDNDADGIAVASAIDLNGGTITDALGYPTASSLPAYTLPTIRVDAKAPEPLTALAAVATGAGQIKITFTAPEACTVYFTALDASQTAGTAAQIVAGRDASANLVRHGSLALAAGVSGTYTLKGLASGTVYTVHATVGDAAGNVAAAAPLVATATTAAVPNLPSLNWSLMTLDAPCGEDPRLAFAPDGTPYVAFQSTVVSGKLLVQRYMGGVWSPVGGTTGLSAGPAYGLQLAFAPDGTPYVAYYDALLADKAVVKRFTGGAWSAVGPDTGLSDGAVTTLSLAFAPDGTPWLAYADSTLSNKAVVRRYAQGAWTAVGSGTGVTDVGATTLDLVFGLDGTAHLAFRNSADSGHPAVWFWSEVSAVWFTGDPSASLPAADRVHLAAAPDGTLYLAYRDSSDYTVGVARHDAAGWTQIGDSQPASTWLDLAVGADGVPFLCYRKGTSGSGYRAYVSTYNGSTWVQSGPYVAAGELSYPSLQIAPDGLPYVVCCDEATDKVVVAKLASAMNTVGVPVHGTYGAGQTLAFTANYTAPVSVTGTPRLPLTIGSTTRYADYTATGSTSTALRFLYTVQAGELDLDGLEVGDVLDLNGSTIVEPSGWSAGTDMGGVDDCSGLHIDAVAPDTTITSQPANPSTSASASFTFSGNDDSGSGVASFEASLDGAAYAAATSPLSLTGLADGPHTFAARAVDAAGNADPTPAAYTWTVDTVVPSAPDIAALLATPASVSGMAESGSTVRVYDGATLLGSTTVGADGAWTVSLPVLPGGAHTLTATVTDTAGHTGAGQSFRFASSHSGDSDGDWRIGLPELLWMVELFNTADGAQRTGAYHSAPASAEGFAPGSGSLEYYHSADTDRNGRFDLPELLRAIELYNAMNGTTRTGAYHLDSGSADGFATGAN